MARITPWVVLVGLGLTLAAGCSARVDEIAPQARTVEAEPIAIDPEHDWPWWRGPHRDGHAVAGGIPRQWSATRNVRWRTEIPGVGHGSPAIVGQRVFLATAEGPDGGKGQQMLVCLDRTTGQELWTQQVHAGRLPSKHFKNSHASMTPACDGRAVYTTFAIDGEVRVTAFDLEGQRLWNTVAGPFSADHGYGASPALWDDLVIVLGDNDSQGFLAGLHRATGEIVWRVARDNQASYSTPIVVPVGGSPQILISGTGVTRGYDPATGQQLWQVQGPARTTAATMTVRDGWVYSYGGYPSKYVLGIRVAPEGQGWRAEIDWRFRQNVPYVSSPLVVDDWLVTLADDGRLRVLDADTGESLAQARVGGGGFSASLVRAGDDFLASDESGTTYVFSLDPEYHELAVNRLGEPIFATPVVLDGQIFLRTRDAVYCIAEPEE